MDKNMDERAWLHRYADIIDENDLPEVREIMQQYAARTLNRRFREEQADKEKATR